jgi:hypothetical protein
VKTSPKRSYSVIENERFGLVFAKTGSMISGTGFKPSILTIGIQEAAEEAVLNAIFLLCRVVRDCSLFICLRAVVSKHIYYFYDFREFPNDLIRNSSTIHEIIKELAA